MTDDEMQELIRHGWIPPPHKLPNDLRTAVQAIFDAALPERDELLREALDALTECAEALFWSYESDGSSTQDKARARARAAADKIRAALEHQQKETP